MMEELGRGLLVLGRWLADAKAVTRLAVEEERTTELQEWAVVQALNWRGIGFDPAVWLVGVR